MLNINKINLDLSKKGVGQKQLFSKSDYFCAEIQKRNKSNMNTDILTGDETMKPYTVEELLKRAEEGRRQIAMGNYSDIDDVLRELDQELQSEAV